MLLSALRHARHPSITTPSRHWPESIKIGGERSKLGFGIYRKAVEMVERGGKLPEGRLEDYRHILRLEVRMKEEKLVKYLGDERAIEEIDGKKRLVRFYPQDPFLALRQSFREMRGGTPRMSRLGR